MAITLRIVLVENLRRSAVRIISRRAAREEADAVADRLLGVDGSAWPIPRRSSPASGRRSPSASSSSSSSACATRTPRRRRPWAGSRSGWRAKARHADELVRKEHQLQGATNVTVRNIITSMRLISDVDWAELFEQVSPVDDVLRAGSDFAAMDFATRNLYRTAIEQMARGTRPRPSRRSRAARSGRASSAPGTCDGDRRQRDPGYYLIGGGRRAFERSLGFRPPGLSLRRRFTSTGIAVTSSVFP